MIKCSDHTLSTDKLIPHTFLVGQTRQLLPRKLSSALAFASTGVKLPQVSYMYIQLPACGTDSPSVHDYFLMPIPDFKM